ncbi:hypothetical protein A2U01_0029076 [Trifolium medium]|uniref:Uncharacterized protein n=1 Tax=Trifolium medium TaxID=97028 RepID=A0A392P9S1_9FABA|nr:hypothetical protein [Trifolium medium]
MPSITRPKISIARLTAEAFRADPMRKLIPPPMILARRPYFLVIGDAIRDATKPAMYREEGRILQGSHPWKSPLLLTI